MMSGVQIERVADLYDAHERFGLGVAPDQTGYNPLSGRVKVIPRQAEHFAMVLENDESKVALAQRILKGMAGRRKVQQVVVDKSAVNFSQFSRPGRVVVMYA